MGQDMKLRIQSDYALLRLHRFTSQQRKEKKKRILIMLVLDLIIDLDYKCVTIIFFLHLLVFALIFRRLLICLDERNLNSIKE